MEDIFDYLYKIYLRDIFSDIVKSNNILTSCDTLINVLENQNARMRVTMKKLAMRQRQQGKAGNRFERKVAFLPPEARQTGINTKLNVASIETIRNLSKGVQRNVMIMSKRVAAKRGDVQKIQNNIAQLCQEIELLQKNRDMCEKVTGNFKK